MSTVLFIVEVLGAWCLVSVIFALAMGRVFALQRGRFAPPATETSQPGSAEPAIDTPTADGTSQRDAGDSSAGAGAPGRDVTVADPVKLSTEIASQRERSRTQDGLKRAG
jgi:hypothetical protein